MVTRKMTLHDPADNAEIVELLRAVESNHAARRCADAEQLRLAREWATVHTAPRGANHSREIGAVQVTIQEYAPAELALAWHTHPLAAQKLMADALDLASRMPLAWDSVQAGELPAWVARKLARITRDLAPDDARIVDLQLADEYPDLPPGRLLSLAEGRAAAVTPELLNDRVAEAARKHEVRTTKPIDGTANLFARMNAADAAKLSQTCDLIADMLAAADGNPDDRPTHQQLRAAALGLLADPQAALDFLQGRDPRRGKAVVYLHLTPGTLQGGGVARAEELGAQTLQMLADLLGHEQITLKPVIDLNDEPASDCYEVPVDIAERVHLIKPADIYPWAESLGRKVDLDHTKRWPIGATRIDNLGKMVRRHHRIKTHAAGWSVRQLPGHQYLWRSPHGRYTLVDRYGTHPIRYLEAFAA